MKGVTDQMSALIAAVNGKSYSSLSASEFYVASGDAVDWFWRDWDGRMALTVELRPDSGSANGFVINADQIDDTTKENVPAAMYFAEYLAKHKDVDFLSHSFQGDVTADADGDGVADWFPTCYDSSAPRCLTPVTTACSSSSSSDSSGSSGSSESSASWAPAVTHVLVLQALVACVAPVLWW